MKDDLKALKEEVKRIAPELREELAAARELPEWARRAFKEEILDKAIHYLSPEDMRVAILTLLTRFELDASEIQANLESHRIKLKDKHSPGALLRIVYDLEEAALIEGFPAEKKGRSIKKYRLREQGRKALDQTAPSATVAQINALLQPANE
jgi:DNA-binding PadR family transcriptional regulator